MFSMKSIAKAVVVGGVLFSAPAFAQSSILGACTVETATFYTEDNGCKDLTTGLVWSAGNIFDNEVSGMDLASAVAYCRDLVQGGFSDWRQATVSELTGVASRGALGSLNVLQQRASYWSSTTNKGNAYAVDLSTGAVTSHNAKRSYLPEICVRVP